MPYEFCTVLDVNYLARALALHRSLLEHCDDFKLRVYCMDRETSAFLDRLRLPSVETVEIEEVERADPELARVKGDRTPVEYCWTATPPIVLHMLEDGGGELVSYIDADTLCFGDPQPLFAEMNGASVLLIPDVGLPNDELGKFLAGLISFRNDERGRDAAGWWRERCLAWCYDRIEPGLYGAVRHLDDWPERYSFVRVARHPGATAGPWNIGRLGLAQRGSRLFVRGEPLIFYHCVARWLYRGRLTALPRRGFLSSYYHRTSGPEPLVWAAAFPTPEREHALVEAPYMERIAEAMRELRRLDASFEAGTVPLTARELGYSVLRWALPRSVRHGLKQAFLSRAPKRRGPPGSSL